MNLFYLEEIDSTNKYAKEHIQNLSDKTVVYTFNQTNGRGRLERKWSYLGKDNIYASIVLKPSEQMREVYSNLTQYLCVVLAQTFEEYGVILAEGVIEKGKLEGLVLGFGINLNTKKELLDKIDQPATSLNIETSKTIDKEIFLKKLLERFCLRYDKFIETGFLLIKEEYLKRAGFLNKNISVKVFDRTISGIAKDITV